MTEKNRGQQTKYMLLKFKKHGWIETLAKHFLNQNENEASKLPKL
jgi:hypothetical protein